MRESGSIILEQDIPAVRLTGSGCETPPLSRSRILLHGKFFVRDGRWLRIQGVTYGPFAPNAEGEAFPAPEQTAADFAFMQVAGINAVRTYHLPPRWFLDLADKEKMAVLIDVPWRKHVCFLDSMEARTEAREAVQLAVRVCRGHPSVLAYSIANEIPPSVVRWHGRRRVERFLTELADVARQTEPNSLVTYANFPPTEYLDLSFLDFVTFNVYLHDREDFRRYLLRLQNLVGDRPLILGELGMDTLRSGEAAQAEFLAGHVREATLLGLAGSFVFSWTDDWFTGGHFIQDWAFGITRADRQPKASYQALGEIFKQSPSSLLSDPPRVSVVVCSYNGGGTLAQCLRSLLTLDYPDYEVIVVDDGSTDDTRDILARFPSVRAIHQANQGLSAARNIGLRAARGDIIAYTDSDCFADRNWLIHLIYAFQHCDAAAVGGPNLTAEDGWLAACVAAAPGQPTHVLESDQVAEHIPGCNMAFRREALLAVNGFDPAYRRAGDDVDLCWRLQQAGYWITFAPGAFVWHHRRQTPRAYLRQQAGYGEAEALLRFKHPDKFNGRGDGKWRGVLYGSSLRGLCLTDAIIYRGIFGTGLFQCLYRPVPAHWALLPSTLEWHLAASVTALVARYWVPAWSGVAAMLVLSLLVAALQAAQARLAPAHDGPIARLLVMALCYVQPLVRSWRRYRTRLLAYRPPVGEVRDLERGGVRMPLSGGTEVVYWSEGGARRLQLLGCVIRYLNEHRWGRAIDSGWSDWDLEIYCHPWTIVRVFTVEEDHGSGRHLIRIRYRLWPSGYVTALVCLAALGVAAALFWPWPAGAVTALSLVGFLTMWGRGVSRAAQVLALFDRWADDLGMVRCCSVSCARGGRMVRLLRGLARLCSRHADTKKDLLADASSGVRKEKESER
jgi:GT2 family glycosyltransferase